MDPDYWDTVSEEAKDLVRSLLALEEKKRPTAKEALQHPWIQGKGVRSNHMENCQKKLRDFNAKRKLKGGVYGVMGAQAFAGAGNYSWKRPTDK
jgi:serine/threonine protein kinase